ncbi:Lrp/AsnC family transcriptional regulator [Bacillota bacterium LX-D]|nr:Lrp/AsnC family transcriptional regulator [Bacillota bacterium LX-D]
MRRAILEIIEKDSRISVNELAKMLNADPKEIEKEIKHLEDEKIIVGYQTLINWEKFDNNKVSALIDVKVAPQRDVGFDQVAERIQRFPEVKAVSLMSGGYDLSVSIEGKSLKQVSQFVFEKLACMEHVQSTMTHFELKKYKQAGIIFENQDEDSRQVIIP